MRTTIVSGLKLLLTFLATQGKVVFIQSISQFPDRFTVPYLADRVLGVDTQHLLPIETARGDYSLLREVQVNGSRRARGGARGGVSDAIKFFDYFRGQHKFYLISMAT
jgi:hypothetical protein